MSQTISLSLSRCVFACTTALVLLFCSVCYAGQPTSKEDVLDRLAEVFGEEVDVADIDKDDICVVFAFEKSVAFVGSFANDRGCMREGAFVQGVFVKHTKGLAKAVLLSQGWAGLEPKDRIELVMQWANRPFANTIVSFEANAFKMPGTPKFAPPAAMVVKDAVHLAVWVQLPSGMVWEESYQKHEYVFKNDGTTTQTTVDSFSVPGEDLKAFEAKQATQ